MITNAFYIGIDPVIGKLGPITISWYGLMIALAVVIGIGWAVWQVKKNPDFSYNTIFTAALIAIPSGIVFSKLLHVIDQWSYYVQHPGRIISGEGLTIWGAVLGGVLSIWLYSLIARRFKFSHLADILVPGIILAQAVGRVGCTINGCCPGIVSRSPISIIYTNPNSYAPLGVPTLPIVELEFFFDLALFGLLLYLRPKVKPAGALFLIYLVFYGAWRFGIEFFRAGTPFFFGMHQAQFIGLIVVLVAVPLLVLRLLSNRRMVTSEPLPSTK